jgi:RNA polymerase sigma factor (sigma-70 family)
VSNVVALRPALTTEQAVMVAEAKATGMVEKIARPLAFKYAGMIDGDDLVSLGYMGLVEAGRTYRGERARFPPFARPRVRGAMWDGIRCEAFEARVERAGMRAADELLAHYRDDFDILAHDKDELQRRLDKFSDAVLVATLLGMTEEAQKQYAPDEADDREEYLEVRAFMQRGLKELPTKHQRVMTLLYTDGRSQIEAAKIMDVDVSTVRRIHEAAVERLRKWMRIHGVDAPPTPATVPEPGETGGRVTR